MKKYLFLVLFIINAINLLSLPILTEVRVKELPDEIKVFYKILQSQCMEIQIDVNIFNPKTKNIVNVLPERIRGDFGKIEPDSERTYGFVIPKDELPPEFSFKDYLIMPKVIWNRRIYYEMELLKQGSSEYLYFISKFETSNEQFSAFVNDDGYEIEDYWIISGSIMPKSSIGWEYQTRYNIFAPEGWDLAKQPYWKTAYSNFIYGPVTSIRWFEAYAYANWAGCELPTYKQVMSFCKNKKLSKQEETHPKYLALMPVCSYINKNGSYPLQQIMSNVGEWLQTSTDILLPSCPGCREMYFIINNFLENYERLEKKAVCPLYRNKLLGFRTVAKIHRKYY